MSHSKEIEFIPTSVAGLLIESEDDAVEIDIRKNEGWPDFPFFWIKQPNMSSLQQIASRLKDKVETFRRSGITGETSAVEKQIIEQLSGLQQQVLEIHDAVQAAMRIIDDNRPSRRLKRMMQRIATTEQRVLQRIRNNAALTVFGAISTFAFVITGLAYLVHFLNLSK